MHESLLSERLVRVALEAAPPRRAAARSLFDFCACVAHAGDAMPAWPLDTAGRLAVRAHAGDGDDLHLGSVTHPGGVVWAAVVATAADRDVALGDANAAAALGYELTVRLGEALGSAHRRRWHTTATSGAVGAAGAVALLLGADETALVAAVGHALSVAGGSIQALAERSGTRLLHRAHAASTGVACARAAVAGLDATRAGLESGTGATAADDVEAFAAALLASRDTTALEETGFRLHGASGFAHAAIDAASAVGAIDPAEVARVEVHVAPPAVAALASNPSPVDDEQAWWSVEHAVAARLAEGGVDPLAPGLRHRTDVRELCRRIDLVPHEDGWQAVVEVTLRDGTLLSGHAVEPWGHRHHPASDDDLLRKWRTLTGGDGSGMFERLLTADPELRLGTVLGDAAAVVRASSRG